MHHAAIKMGDGLQSLVELPGSLPVYRRHVAVTASNFACLIRMVPEMPPIATVHRRLAIKFEAMASVRILEYPVRIDVARQQLNWHFRSDNDPTHRCFRNAFLSASETLQ